MNSQLDNLEDRLHFAVEIARESGTLIMGYFRSVDLSVDFKSDDSPVTKADKEAELLLRKRIEEKYPEDGILGEEFAEKKSQSGIRWILDPIDGTKAFMHGVPLFGTLIGMTQDNAPLLGVCHLPAVKETIYAAVGHGAWWQVDEEPIREAKVSEVENISEALLCYTEINLFHREGRFEGFDRLRQKVRATRGWGDCFGHMLVATGRAEIAPDPILNIWDASPMLPILQEAGGYFIDWNGNPTIEGGHGISVNAQLKDEVLNCLQKS